MALKKYLLINCSFSMICGLFMLLLNMELDEFFNVSQPIVFTIIGLNLILFAAFVFFVSQSKPIKKILVNIIVTLDILWVFGSLCIVLFDIFNLSFNGYLTISVVAFFIAFLAFKQYSNLQKLISYGNVNPYANT